MENPETRLVQRYFRKMQAHPDGSVSHHGDCDFFSVSFCTCGLLHDLMPMTPDQIEEHYPRFHEERAQYDRAREDAMVGERKAHKKH